MASSPGFDSRIDSQSAVPYVQQLKNLWQKEAADSSLLRDQVSSLQQQLQHVRTELPSKMQQEMLDFYETFDVYSEFADLPELIPRWISRMWFDAAHVLFIFNTSNDNPMLASSFSNAVEFSDSNAEFEEFTNRLLQIGKPVRCTVNSVPAYIANYVGVAIAEMVLYPLAQSDGPAVFAVLNPIGVQDVSQHMIEANKALHHAMRSIRLSVEHALEQERYERQLKAEKDMGELYRQLATIYESTFADNSKVVIPHLVAEFESLIDRVAANVVLVDATQQTLHTTAGACNLRDRDSLSTRAIRSGRTTYCTNRHNVLRDPEIESPQAQEMDSILVIPFAVPRSTVSNAVPHHQGNRHAMVVRTDAEGSSSIEKRAFGAVVFGRGRGIFAPEEISALEQIVDRVSPGLHRWWSSETRDMLRPPAQVKVDTIRRIHTIQQRLDQAGWEALADPTVQQNIVELLGVKLVCGLIVSAEQAVYDIRDRSSRIEFHSSLTRNLVMSGTVTHGSFGSQSEPWLKYHKSHLESEVVLHAVVVPWSATAKTAGRQRISGVLLAITEQEIRTRDVAIATQLHGIIQTSVRPSIHDELEILEGELAAQQATVAQLKQAITESSIVCRFATSMHTVQTFEALATEVRKAMQDLMSCALECRLAVSDALFGGWHIWQGGGIAERTTEATWRLGEAATAVTTVADVVHVIKKQADSTTIALPFASAQLLNYNWQCLLLLEAPASALLGKHERLHEVIAAMQPTAQRLLHTAARYIPTWQPSSDVLNDVQQATRSLAMSATTHVSQISSQLSAIVLEIRDGEVFVCNGRHQTGLTSPEWLDVDRAMCPVIVPHKTKMALQSHPEVPPFHSEALVVRVGNSHFRLLVVSAMPLLVTPFELDALLKLTESIAQHVRSLSELDAAVSHIKQQDRLLENFPPLRTHSTLESILAAGLDQFGRLCEFDTTALYLWRDADRCYRLTAGGLHTWCKLHEAIRPGDGIMSKLNPESAAHTLRITKHEFAVFVPIAERLSDESGGAHGGRTYCLVVGIRDNEMPLTTHEQRLLVSFKQWLSVISREYIAMAKAQSTQQQLSYEQATETAELLEYHETILGEWRALSRVRRLLVEMKTTELLELSRSTDNDGMVVKGLKHIMENVADRFEISLLVDALGDGRVHERDEDTPRWVQQAIKQGVIQRGYVKLRRLDEFIDVGEELLRHNDELLAAEVACMIEDTLLVGDLSQQHAVAIEKLSAELQGFQHDAAFRPVETLALLCQTANKLFRSASHETKLVLPEPSPPHAHELFALTAFAHSLVNGMIPHLNSDTGIRGLLDIVERAVPATMCECLFFHIHWPSDTSHKTLSALATGMVAHVQASGQPVSVSDNQAGTKVTFFPVHFKGHVSAVLEIGENQEQTHNNTDATESVLGALRECVGAVIEKVATSWSSIRTPTQIWTETLRALESTVTAPSGTVTLQQGAAVSLDLFGAAASAALLPEGSSFKGEVRFSGTALPSSDKDIARVAASFLPQDKSKSAIFGLEEPMLTARRSSATPMFLALFPVHSRDVSGWLAMERSTPFRDDEVECAAQLSRFLSRLSRVVDERAVLERHTAELVEVRKLASHIDASARFGTYLRELALQPDLPTTVQALYSLLPKMMKAEAVRLHLKLGGDYITSPFTAEEQRTDKLRTSITANCFQTGKIAVFDSVSAAEHYPSTWDRVSGFEGLACAFIPVKSSTNSVIAVIIAAFSDDFPIAALSQHDVLASAKAAPLSHDAAVRWALDAALHASCCLSRHVEYHELRSNHRSGMAVLRKTAEICSRPWMLLETFAATGRSSSRTVAITLATLVCNAMPDAEAVDVILTKLSDPDSMERSSLFGYSVTRNESSMDVTSILQEGRCVEQIYRHDDDLLERCRTDGKLLLNGLDATQFGVLVHLRNVVGEELGFIRATFKHGNSQDAVAIDVMQLFAMFASTIIQHVADGPYNQLALPSTYRAKYVEVLTELSLATHHEFDTPAELCEMAEQALRQLPSVATAQLVFEVKQLLDTPDDSDKQVDEPVLVWSPSSRSLKSRSSSRLFFGAADGVSPTKRPESAKSSKYVWDSYPYRTTLTVRTTGPLHDSDEQLFLMVPKLVGSTAVRIAELMKLKLKVTELSKQVQATHGILSAKDAEVRTLEATKSRCEQEWLAAKGQLDTQMRRTLEAEEELARLRAEAGQLMNMSPTEVMRRLEKASASVRLLKQEKEQLTLNLTALQEALEELKQKLAKTRQKLTASERERQQLEQSRKALVEKEQLLTETVRSVSAEKQGIIEELARAKAQEKKLARALRDKETQITELEASRHALEDQCKFEQARANDLATRIEEIRFRQTQMGARWKQLMESQSPGAFPTAPTTL